jgi:hypothetical protein
MTLNVAADASAPDAPPTPVTWWNTGDSYAAGEGLLDAQGDCQQSNGAFGPKSIEILREQRGWDVLPAPFSACTGDITMDESMSTAEQRFLNVRPSCKASDSAIETRPEGAMPTDAMSLTAWAQSQPGWTSDGRFDVITLSMGGNDFCFPDIVADCLGIVSDSSGVLGNAASYTQLIATQNPQGRCGVIENELRKRVDALLDGGPGGIPRLTVDGPTNVGLPELWEQLESEHLNADGVLVVVGYPRLITPSSDWQAWRGDRCNTIHRDDADMLGRMAEYLDQRLASTVAVLDGGRGRIRYVSRLQLFDDAGTFHSLCSRGTEWLNTVFLSLRDGTLRKERAFHPNVLGHTTTAEGVAGGVFQWFLDHRASEQIPLSSTPVQVTSAPVVESGDQEYEVGSEFFAQCTIAWPTAPQHGVDSIQMRTFCPSVPQQFLFVDIAYADPDLPVSPSVSTMDVHGQVVDIVRSQYGFTVLVVVADRIDNLR